MTRRLAILAGTAVIVLSGCSKPKAPEGALAAPQPAATEQGPIVTQTPPSMPKRKAGLWKQTVVGSGTTQVSRLCLDAAAEEKLAIWGSQTGKSICAEQDVSATSTGWAFHSRCDMNGAGTVTSDGETKGDFSSRYIVDIKSTTSGASAAQMNGTRKIHISAEWQGPCPTGMAPGDMELPNGVKINMLKLGGN